MALPHVIYEALGDPTRLEIVRRLGERGPLPTLEVVEGLGMSRQAATKHLLVLEQAGVIASRPQGRMVLRELRPEALDGAAEWLARRAATWDRRLQALKRLVEEGNATPEE